MKGRVGDPPAEAADLFRVAPERFIVERDALVKQLRADGRDEEAIAVKALRKPTAVVWALNQLASRDPDGLSGLFDAGRALRAAQQAALTGKGGDELVGAAAARRAAVTQLTWSAVAIMDDAGQRGHRLGVGGRIHRPGGGRRPRRRHPAQAAGNDRRPRVRRHPNDRDDPGRRR